MPVSLGRAGPGHLILQVDGRPHDIRFPATGNLESIVLHVLAGHEYPSLRLPGWSPATILDIGANVGASAVFFALAWPEATIHCFEPSPSTERFLRDNTSWLPGIEVHPYGLLDTDTTLRLYAGTSQCAQASVALSVETRADRYEDIRLVRARNAIGSPPGPILLKIDTEGCEIPILQDIAYLLDDVDILFVEYHSERDRRSIEALLGDRFVLWRSQAKAVHRGTIGWLNARLLTRYPELGALEIPPVAVAAA
jgi:FkbM family methyltransferase